VSETRAASYFEKLNLMEISLFQALCLLPDVEKLPAWRVYWKGTKDNPIQKRRKFCMEFEAAIVHLETFYTVHLVYRYGYGYVIKANLYWFRADPKKVKSHLTAINGHFKFSKHKKAA
jgi:hypothetical protein